MLLQQKRRKIYFAALYSLVVCSVTLAAGWAVLPRFFTFPVAMSDRVVLILQADVFILLWVLYGVRLVAHGRRYSEADIDAAVSGPPSKKIAIEAAFLQNTLEQAFLAVGIHLVLATLLSGNALALIIASIALFALGRVTFLVGYKRGAEGRAFGMVTTSLPTLLGYITAVVMIVSNLIQ